MPAAAQQSTNGMAAVLRTSLAEGARRLQKDLGASLTSRRVHLCVLSHRIPAPRKFVGGITANERLRKDAFAAAKLRESKRKAEASDAFYGGDDEVRRSLDCSALRRPHDPAGGPRPGCGLLWCHLALASSAAFDAPHVGAIHVRRNTRSTIPIPTTRIAGCAQIAS